MDLNKFMNLPFVQAFLKMIANIADYKGRTSRADFWWAIVAVIILNTAFGIIFSLFGFIGNVLAGIVYIAIGIPTVMMWIRRMHDVGKPGWWCIIPILDIVFAAQDGQAGDNQYGADPKSNMGY